MARKRCKACTGGEAGGEGWVGGLLRAGTRGQGDVVQRGYWCRWRTVCCTNACSACPPGSAQGAPGTSNAPCVTFVVVVCPAQEATFSLGDRISVLDQLDKPAIIPHMAEYEGRKFPYEVREGQGGQREEEGQGC